MRSGVGGYGRQCQMDSRERAGVAVCVCAVYIIHSFRSVRTDRRHEKRGGGGGGNSPSEQKQKAGVVVPSEGYGKGRLVDATVPGGSRNDVIRDRLRVHVRLHAREVRVVAVALRGGSVGPVHGLQRVRRRRRRERDARRDGQGRHQIAVDRRVPLPRARR